MTRKCVCVSVVVAVLLAASVEANQVTGVEFSGKMFTMTCPKNGKWFHKGSIIPGSEESTLLRPYDDTAKGLYHCEYGTDSSTVKYYFYVQGRVCDNCFELTPYEMMVAIVVDVLLTLLVMLITYKCSQKRSSAAASHTPKAAPPRGRGPAVPSPDYEALDPRTSSHGTYSKVNRLGM
ncbi:T-cell surface glycoprotein CD3 epsilon chain-like isoform X2 [Nelusetta ayraudi]|uniref:T-cell surface glycoprotein CD3 epsilon chain-like isoform X2 n=1 Tax=Nelusetta ayraudi TaxID=303726 RepID=UPI003F6F9BF6